MKRAVALLFLLAIVFSPGCEIVGDIFEAGVWVGIVLVVLILGGLAWLLRKLLR